MSKQLTLSAREIARLAEEAKEPAIAALEKLNETLKACLLHDVQSKRASAKCAPAAVPHSAPKPTAYKLTITSRDAAGAIKTATLTPL